ncbi:hypothetical protein VFPPC_18452 [Pochonia chlamydosporia 170]|uniref:Uncharacterized protein n=1 Tax=Pochonia chlamydosporia 170 TaxID=1380566 RepID=A0A219AP37_METCM|nr:hypothetical protein VFPPC_18452 [Pochonia chlamydosporia 170]OWT42481.1 hypothetical protein VFPPC_18452 [Pochonia chlamydosporia 170]
MIESVAWLPTQAGTIYMYVSVNGDNVSSSDTALAATRQRLKLPKAIIKGSNIIMYQ